MSEEKIKNVEKESSSQISRREFLRDAGLVVGGATIGSVAILSACSGAKTETITNTLTKTVTVTSTISGPTVTTTNVANTATAPTNEINLNINGGTVNVLAKPSWTLQYVLNKQLGLTGAKEWCDQGGCGSCTVIIDGRPVLACMTLACEVEGKKIQTVEGIAVTKHPVIDAYIANNAMQCGYCTPGFVVTAKALLDKNPKPTADDIKLALSGNICRCSTYPYQVQAVLDAAAALAKPTATATRT
jgi:aerobic-type carbon monoxide dehydrogenase small subunit (CoxS/CutS family)